MRRSFLAALTMFFVCGVEAQEADLRWWPHQDRNDQRQFEHRLNTIATPASLKAYHERFASEPHIAGTPGDDRSMERLIESFLDLGLEVQVHEFWAYLPSPIDAAVEIVGAGENGAALSLPIRERDLAEDPFDQHEELTFAWNAYSGSGDVTASIVYANYGTKADFDTLAARGVDLTGAIVLARYGGNYRGYKAKFAEEAGAIGVIIYTDPADSGFVRGEVYPEGGWANESYIQRGSIKTLDYAGDPLTPGTPATEHATRLDPDAVALPRIPVQPIGYGAAKEILTRMNGAALPGDLATSWQGGFDFAYKLTGGDDLRVRLMVKQDRSIKRTANILATLPGATYPDEKIIIGCHHDAWCHGAGDPQAGTMLVYEVAKCFTEMAAAGHRPERSIVFANWGAEEYGIIGSVEYVEEFAQELSREAIAYINLDAATMGPNFGSAASPSLKMLIESVVKQVPPATESDSDNVFDAWLGDASVPTFGNLGGGSDHIGFYCHLAIPSCSVGSGGAPGSAYHSNYDNIAWYQKVVGDDYLPALMLTRVVNLMAARLANAPVLPLDPARYAPDMGAHLDALEERASELKFKVDFKGLRERLKELQSRTDVMNTRLLAAFESGALNASQCEDLNDILRGFEQRWRRPEGLDDRPWFRNLFAATDPDSGYAAWMLPALRRAIEDRDSEAVQRAIGMYFAALDGIGISIEALEKAIP